MSIRRQGTTVFTAILMLVASTVVVQLWLLTVSMDAVLSGESRTALAGAIGSTLLLAINAGLLRYVFRFDREVQRSDQE